MVYLMTYPGQLSRYGGYNIRQTTDKSVMAPVMDCPPNPLVQQAVTVPV